MMHSVFSPKRCQHPGLWVRTKFYADETVPVGVSMVREPRPHHTARRIGPTAGDRHDTVSIKVGPVPVKKGGMRWLHEELEIGERPESSM